MRLYLTFFLLLGLPGLLPAADTATGRVFKVLPLLLDAHGRDSTTPSLFDRDAYQAQLREHTNEVTGIRVDVLWHAAQAAAAPLKLRVELHGVGPDNSPRVKTFETPVTAGFFRHWTQFTLAGDDYKQFGSLVAWRATLWDGDRLLGEQKSFLW